MKELNIEIAVKIYDYEELDAADREKWAIRIKETFTELVR